MASLFVKVAEILTTHDNRLRVPRNPHLSKYVVDNRFSSPPSPPDSKLIRSVDIWILTHSLDSKLKGATTELLKNCDKNPIALIIEYYSDKN